MFRLREEMITPKNLEEAKELCEVCMVYGSGVHFKDCTFCKRIAKALQQKEDSAGKLVEALEHIVDLHICDPSFDTAEEMSELEHKRFKIAEDALATYRKEIK